MEAAEAVCAPVAQANLIDRQDVLMLLGRLVDKSLLQVVPGRPDSELATRYRFLDTICTFAHMKLAAAGEVTLLRDRHAAHYVELVEEAEPRLLRKEQGHYYRLLQAEADNIQAVIEWSASANEEDSLVQRAESGLRIVGALLWFWWSHGSTHEGLDLALRVTALPPIPELQI